MKEIPRDDRNVRFERDDTRDRLLKSEVHIELTLVDSQLGEFVVSTVPEMHIRHMAYPNGRF